MNIKKLLLIFLSILLMFSVTSCSDDEEQALIEAVSPEVNTTTDEDTGGDSFGNTSTVNTITRKEFLKKFIAKEEIQLGSLEDRLEKASEKQEYFFDIKSGKCYNLNGELERGDSTLLECSRPDLVESKVEEFSDYQFYGADARGANVADAQVSIYDLVFGEVKFDKNSVLNTEKKPFYKLFQNQKRVYFSQKNLEKKFANSLKKYRTKRNNLKKKFKKAKTDNARLKIKAQIDKVDLQISLVKLNHKIARNKSKRHLKELKWISKVEELENLDDKFSNKNKKSTFFDGASAYELVPSNELIKSNTFSISLWFKSSINQQDKRLFNLHRAETPGSAINLSVKNDRVIMGLHDGSKYISNELEFSYDDDQWHHLVVSKTKKAFIFYVNGVKALEYDGEFSGFGSYPVYFGSYNGSGYFFAGDIDEVSLWSKGLSKKEVKTIYNSGVANNLKLQPFSTFLSHWFRMGDHKKDSDESLYDQVSKLTASIIE